MNTFGIQRSFRNSRDTGYQKPGSTVLFVQILKKFYLSTQMICKMYKKCRRHKGKQFRRQNYRKNNVDG